MFMEPDKNLVVRLREMAAAGSGVCDMTRWLLEASSVTASSGRIQVIACIQRAFHLSAGDAAAVGAWHIFPGGTWSDEELEQFLLPRIHATRARWEPAHS